MKRLLTFALLAAVALPGCNNDGEKEIRVSGVSLNRETLALVEGESATLTAKVSPAEATNRKVSWRSSDPITATVDGGYVKAEKAGTTTITVTTEDGGKEAECTVTVTAAVAELVFADNAAFDIPASTLGVAISAIDVAGGASGGTKPYTFAASGLPSGISISAAGIIHGTPDAAAGAGTATITVTDSTVPAAQSKSITIACGEVTAVKTVTVGEQSGSLAAGTDDPVSFPVTTTNIADGAHPVSYIDLPAGIRDGNAEGKVVVTGGSGTLWLYGLGNQAAGEYAMGIVLDGATSNLFTLTVLESAVYAIKLSPSSVSFGEREVGYTISGYATVTVLNTGNSRVNLMQPASTKYEIGPLSQVAVIAGGEATFTVRPREGLGAGEHNEDIVITGVNGTNSATATLRLRFTVY